MIAWLREPLVHFALLGVLLYVFAGWIDPSPGASVVIDAGALSDQHRRRTGSAPDEATLSRLIDRETERALLFAEAQALRLGDGDEIVRRRLIQKMTLILDEAMAPSVPSDAELEAFIASTPERFAVPARRTITHVLIRRSPTDRAQAASAMAALRDGRDPKTLGAPFPHGHTLGPLSAPQLSRIVDESFAKTVFDVREQGWFGPIESPYGLHLVRIDLREDPRPASLDDVRRQAMLGWRERESQRSRAHALSLLREKYRVIVEGRP